MDPEIEEGWRGERRARLLDAASRVFSRLTYDQASMDEIAHEAGVGKPTLYRYFESKDALFSAVFVEALDALEARLDAVMTTETGVAARLHGLVLATIPTFRDHLVSLRFLGEDSAALDRSKRRIFHERRARIVHVLARAVSAGKAEGDVRDDVDPERIGQLVIGMVWSGTASIRADDDAIAREIAALVLGGIGRADGAGRVDEARAGEIRLAAPILQATVLPNDDRRPGRGRPHEAVPA